MPIREKTVKSGDWRTLESFWNVTTTAFFEAPAGAEIKIRYGASFFAVDRQRQKLDGMTTKRLAVSRWSAVAARIQIRTKEDGVVRYAVEPGNVANPTYDWNGGTPPQ